MMKEYLHFNHHEPWEAKANNEPDSIYTEMPEDHCQNVIDTLGEVTIDLDETTGVVERVAFSNGQSLETAAYWYKNATTEEREQFLKDIGAYAVSDSTWYVHPE